MYKKNNLKGSGQVTRQKDFGSRVLQEEPQAPFKENYNDTMYDWLDSRNSSKMSMASSRFGEDRNENLECQEDFVSSQYITEQGQSRRKLYAHQRTCSQSQENVSNFFRYSHNGRPANMDCTRASFKKQEVVRASFDNATNRPLMRAKSITSKVPNTLKGCSSNQDLRSTGLLEKDPVQNSMVMSKIGTTLQCANKDGKKAKYRIIDSEEQEELFYCSKCSIMLLQQGFKVERFDNAVQDPNMTRTLKRKAEIQHLNILSRELQSKLKKYASNLQDTKYFTFIEEQRARISETYDSLLNMIEEMKESEIQKLQIARQSLISDIQRQKGFLFQKFTNLQTVRDDLQQLQKVLSKISDSEYSSLIKASVQNIQDSEGYQPLQFKINSDSSEKRTQRLLQQITTALRNRTHEEQFSFQKAHQKLNQSSREDNKHPFRTLFPQDFKKSKYPKVGGKSYITNQSIQQCYEDSFVSNISSKFHQ